MAPKISETNLAARDKRLYPKDCRQLHTTYSGRLYATFEYAHDGVVVDRYKRLLGQVPIMIKVDFHIFVVVVVVVIIIKLTKQKYLINNL
jgi:DNA-directed RNA polymerase beta subunit